MRPWYYTWNNVIGVLHDLQYSFARMLYQTEQLPDVLHQTVSSISACWENRSTTANCSVW